MVAFRNFDTLKDCDSCPFHMYFCKITGEGLYNVEIGERHEKCPLVNIDIDEMYCSEDAGDFQRGYNLALEEIKEQLV